VASRSIAFLAKPGHFPFELSHKLVDERLIAEENVPQPVQHTLFQSVGTDAAVGIA
jgi:hypothetical protein